MFDYSISQTNQATTQDWLNATSNIEISPFIGNTPMVFVRFDPGGEVDKVGYSAHEAVDTRSSQTSPFDWEAGTDTLLKQYDEAWRRLAVL